MHKYQTIKPGHNAQGLPLSVQLELWRNRLNEVSLVDLAGSVRGRLVSDAHSRITHIRKMLAKRYREEMEDLEFPGK